MKEITDEEAILRLMVLRNMSGEYVEERDNYLYRFNFPLPTSIPIDARKGIERIEGVDYTNDAVGVMKNLAKYQPFLNDYNTLKERYIEPAEYFIYISQGVPVNINTYDISMGFKHSKVINEINHKADGKVYVKEFRVDREGEYWKIILRRYSERPAWRGLAWKEEQVKDIPSHTLYYSAGIYLKARERFPKAMLERGSRYYRGKFRAYIYRYFDRNPVLDLNKAGYLVMYKKGKAMVLSKEFLFMDKLPQVKKHIDRVAELVEVADRVSIKEAQIKVNEEEKEELEKIKNELEQVKKKEKKRGIEKGGVEIG